MYRSFIELSNDRYLTAKFGLHGKQTKICCNHHFYNFKGIIALWVAFDWVAFDLKTSLTKQIFVLMVNFDRWHDIL